MVGEEDELKGMISYPCCKAQKAMVYMNAHGQSSHKCPNCGKVIVFDYDKMIAWTARPIRGATQKELVPDTMKLGIVRASLRCTWSTGSIFKSILGGCY